MSIKQTISAEIDVWRQIQAHINNLMRLLDTYCSGAILEDHKA